MVEGAMSDQAEMVSVPKALLASVLEMAEFNSVTVQGEFSVGPDERAAHEKHRDSIDELRRIADIPSP